MILKTRVYTDLGYGWELIPINSIKYNRLDNKKAKQIIEGKINFPYLNGLYEFVDGRTEARKAKNKANIAHNKASREVMKDVTEYSLIRAWRKEDKTGEPIIILTNMPVYLLNDEGKTVEKII